MSDVDRVEALAVRRQSPPQETARASRAWWDREAASYQLEHGPSLEGFVWGPEGLREDDARLLGDLAELDGPVLEVGCGAAQCARWLCGRGVYAIGMDLSAAQLAASARLDDAERAPVPLVQADAVALPFVDEAFAGAFSSYGALPFVNDARAVLREVRRVLRPGAPWVFSVTHPARWSFPDDPGPSGLTATMSYFDRTPYVEEDATGAAAYVEHHRTLGDWVRAVVAAGFDLIDLVEPEWPENHDTVWGGWSPLRGRLLPGTAIFSCRAR